MLKDKSPEYNFLVFFNSINMLGWKTKEDINFYWKTKNWSSVLLFLGLMCIFFDYLNTKHVTIDLFIVYSLLITISISFISMMFYISYDSLFKIIGGKSIAFRHIARTWANCHNSLIPIIDKCDPAIISEENKTFLKNNPYDKRCLIIIYEAWYSAINKELNSLNKKNKKESNE